MFRAWPAVKIVWSPCVDRSAFALGSFSSAAAGQYSEAISAFPYQQANLNPYDYRTSAPYPESEIIAFYNNATVQAAIGVISSPQQEAKVWDTHSARVHAEFTFGETGDWNGHTDGLVERLLRSGVGVLKYEGMVDCESSVQTGFLCSDHHSGCGKGKGKLITAMLLQGSATISVSVK